MSRPFIDIDASYNVLMADLVKLHDKIKQVTNVIGPYRARESVALWMDSVSVRLTSLEELDSPRHLLCRLDKHRYIGMTKRQELS